MTNFWKKFTAASLLILFVNFNALAQEGETRWAVSFGKKTDQIYFKGIATEIDGNTTLLFNDAIIPEDPDMEVQTFFESNLLGSNFEKYLEFSGKDKLTAEVPKLTYNGVLPIFSASGYVTKPGSLKLMLNDQEVSEKEYERVSKEFMLRRTTFLMYADTLNRKAKTPAKNLSGQFVPKSATAGGDIELVQAGVLIELSNRQSSVDGKTVYWDWRIEVNGSEKVSASGSKADGNPIIWGELPSVKHVLVANNQEALDEDDKSLYPYLDSIQQARKERPKAAFTREIVLLGPQLETLIGEKPTSNNSRISYSDFRQHITRDERAKFKTYHQNAESQDSDIQMQSLLRRNPDFHAIVTTATIVGSIESQPIKIIANDQMKDWSLLFGDHKAIIRTIRLNVPGPDKNDRTLLVKKVTKNSRSTGGRAEELANPIFIRDEIVFEVELDESIMREAGNPKTVQLELADAQEKEGIGPNLDKDITLNVSSVSESIFRSDPFIVVDPVAIESGDDKYEDIPKSQRLVWTIDREISPRLIKHPMAKPLPDALVINPGKSLEGSYIDALKRATQCYPNSQLPFTPDWKNFTLENERDLANETAKTLNRVYGFSGQVRSLDVSYGRHAAMILLRDTYVDMMSNYNKFLLRYRNNTLETKLKIGTEIDKIWRGKHSVISGLLVDGGTVHKIVAGTGNRSGIYSDSARTIYSQFGQTSRNLLLTWLNKELRKQLKSTSESVRIANDAGDCNVEDLLLFTGAGFKPIVDYISARVTQIEKDSVTKISYQRPDMIARRELNSVATTRVVADAYNNVEEKQATIVKLLGVVATIGGGAVAISTESSLLAYAVLTIEIADVTYTVADNVQGYSEDQKYQNFARGASVVLGQRYLKFVEDRSKSLTSRALDVLGASLGAGLAGWDVQTINKLASSAIKSAKTTAELGDATLSAAELRAVTEAFENSGDVGKVFGLMKEAEGIETVAKFLAIPAEQLANLNKSAGTGVDAIKGMQSELGAVLHQAKNWKGDIFSDAAELSTSVGKGLPDIQDGLNALSESPDLEVFVPQSLEIEPLIQLKAE